MFSCRKSAIPRRDDLGSHHCRSLHRTLSRSATRKLLWGLTASAGASPCGSCLSKGRDGCLHWKLHALPGELSLKTMTADCESETKKYPPSARLLTPW